MSKNKHNKDYSLKRRYGITIKEYNQMFTEQQGNCKICNKPLDEKHTHVDHNHETKKVRGLLCGNCNRMIGFAKENPDTLKQGAKYLKNQEIYGLYPKDFTKEFKENQKKSKGRGIKGLQLIH
jgi:hypothetical protein